MAYIERLVTFLGTDVPPASHITSLVDLLFTLEGRSLIYHTARAKIQIDLFI